MSVLTINEVVTIAAILRAAQENQPVAFVADNGQVLDSTARAICACEGGGFLGGKEEVRDGYLWVTTASGFERWIPMREVIERVADGTIALCYRAHS